MSKYDWNRLFPCFDDFDPLSPSPPQNPKFEISSIFYLIRIYNIHVNFSGDSWYNIYDKIIFIYSFFYFNFAINPKKWWAVSIWWITTLLYLQLPYITFCFHFIYSWRKSNLEQKSNSCQNPLWRSLLCLQIEGPNVCGTWGKGGFVEKKSVHSIYPITIFQEFTDF